MQGRTADDCRMQYESLSKKEEEEEEDYEEDDKERHEDDIPMEEETQDVPEASIVTLPDGEGDLDITEVPTTSSAAAVCSSSADVCFFLFGFVTV